MYSKTTSISSGQLWHQKESLKHNTRSLEWTSETSNHHLNSSHSDDSSSTVSYHTSSSSLDRQSIESDISANTKVSGWLEQTEAAVARTQMVDSGFQVIYSFTFKASSEAYKQ